MPKHKASRNKSEQVRFQNREIRSVVDVKDMQRASTGSMTTIQEMTNEVCTASTECFCLTLVALYRHGPKKRKIMKKSRP